MGTENPVKTKEDLPGYDGFRDIVSGILKSASGNKFAFISVDIDFFKLFNELYGRKTGDLVLDATSRHLAEIAASKGGAAGYFGSDDFALFIPWENTDAEKLYDLISSPEDYTYQEGFFPSAGIYIIRDNKERISDMYDHSRVALNTISDSFTEHVCVYDSAAHERARDELKLLIDAGKGLKNNEFSFYLQPKCAMDSGKIIGAEALVRWNRSGKVLFPPGKFVPVLESHNSISLLDQYIWDEVCKWQRSLMDEGMDPLPVSVNVSRVDFLHMDVAKHFKSLIDKYELPPSLIELEITESAFVDSSLSLDDTINSLHEYGFKILMDDFGTGYSSLHSLRDLHFDILKTDIRFLDKKGQTRKGIDIMESIISMARLIGVPVIAEGVETGGQADDLLSIGCNYAQGYFFHKPMHRDIYKQLISNPYNVYRGKIAAEEAGQIRISEFLDSNLYSDETLNSILGAVAFIEQDGEDIRLTRATDRFHKLMNKEYADENGAELFMDSLLKTPEEIKRMLNVAEMNLVDGFTDTLSLRTLTDDALHLLARIHMLNERDGRKLFYVNIEKIDPKWSDEDLWRELRDTQDRLSFLRAALNRLPNPIFLKDADARFLFFNDQYARAFGMRRADYIGKTVLDLDYLPEDDRERFQQEDVDLIRKESELSYESDFWFSDEMSHFSLYWSTGVHDKKSGRRGLIGEIVDISRERLIREQLDEAEKELNEIREKLDQ